jgi:hypothetical protein
MANWGESSCKNKLTLEITLHIQINFWSKKYETRKNHLLHLEWLDYYVMFVYMPEKIMKAWNGWWQVDSCQELCNLVHPGIELQG